MYDLTSDKDSIVITNYYRILASELKKEETTFHDSVVLSAKENSP